MTNFRVSRGNALVGSISFTGVIGRMTVSNEGTVLLACRGTFVLGFMAWLAHAARGKP
ncbi:hypothetical protein [Rhodococcus sp. NCIMB 12038]|uniref:hypothetical protein n=1 Tax=Rhodococcus sp. NCIMB 12038 TaxID=933800 RepID=UPI0015C63532|nr:hypothetical protein [Rhodococcus sp. NCIMB 12038]